MEMAIFHNNMALQGQGCCVRIDAGAAVSDPCCVASWEHLVQYGGLDGPLVLANRACCCIIGCIMH